LFKKLTKIKNLDLLNDSFGDTDVYSDNYSDHGLIENNVEKGILKIIMRTNF
jgi:hypothetical protein